MAYIPQSVPQREGAIPDPMNEELERILAAKKARIKVVGVGGAGNNTINRISEMGVVGIETVAINTDAQDLIATLGDKKILIGKELTGGLGAGADPKVGEEAARKLHEEITAKPTVDVHMADLLILYMALAEGKSVFLTRTVSEHLETNVWLAEEILKIRFNIEGTNKLFKVQRTA